MKEYVCFWCVLQENVDPAFQAGAENGLLEEQQMPRRELTLDDEQEIWKDITLIQ